MNKSESPIGLFDSGVGGLTVASAIKSVLPNESMIYFGDTAHLPYGDKSRETIIQYSLSIAKFLLDKGCKIILIACNSASSNAFSEIRAFVGDRAEVLNVIDPVVEHVGNDNSINSIGVIGTKATINSGSYEKCVLKLRPKMKVSSLATPLFVPMIEEGFISDDISNAIVEAYLSRPELKDIDSLILGCTHYPIIMDQIYQFFNPKINVLDSAKIVAEKLKLILLEKNLLNHQGQPKHQFFVSDHTEYFDIIAKLFFGDKIDMTKVSI